MNWADELRRLCFLQPQQEVKVGKEGGGSPWQGETVHCGTALGEREMLPGVSASGSPTREWWGGGKGVSLEGADCPL